MELQQIKFRNKYRYQSFKEISPKARMPLLMIGDIKNY